MVLDVFIASIAREQERISAFELRSGSFCMGILWRIGSGFMMAVFEHLENESFSVVK